LIIIIVLFLKHQNVNHIAPKLAADTSSSSLLYGTKPKPKGAACLDNTSDYLYAKIQKRGPF